DPARNGLKRLSRHPLVRLAEPPRQGDDQLRGDLAMLRDDPPHVAGRQSEQLALRERLDARRASAAVEHRELAEYVPRPKRREGDRAAIRMLPRHSQIAAADDVAGVGGVAL